MLRDNILKPILSFVGRAGLVLSVLLAVIFFIPALTPLQTLLVAALGALWLATRPVVLLVGGAALAAWLAIKWEDRQWVTPDEYGQLPFRKSWLKQNPLYATQANQQHQKIRIIEAVYQVPHHYAPKFGNTVAPEATPALPAPLPLTAWFRQVADHPAHIMLLGDTGSGKSTFARALLAERAKTDKVLVLDPHANLNDWCDVPTVGGGRDFDAIERMIQQLHSEFERRFKPGEDVGQPVTVFIDEVPALASEKKDALSRIVAWAREARKTGIRLVLLSTGWEVKALGIEGQGSVRESFLFLRLGSFARAEVPDIPAHVQYPAVLIRGNDSKQEPQLLDTNGLTALTQPALPDDVVWTPDPALLLPATTPDDISFCKNGRKKRVDSVREQKEKIIELAKQGKNITHIVRALNDGKHSSSLHYEVREILEEAGLV